MISSDEDDENKIVFTDDEGKFIEIAHILHNLRKELKDLVGYESPIEFESITRSFNNVCFAIKSTMNSGKSSHYIRYWFKDGKYTVNDFWNKSRLQFKCNDVDSLKAWLTAH